MSGRFRLGNFPGKRMLRSMVVGVAPNAWGISAKNLREASETGYWMTRAFYVFSIYLAFKFSRDLYKMEALEPTSATLWPALWTTWFPYTVVQYIVILVMLGSAILSAFFPHQRWTRIGVFLTFLTYAAMVNSLGSINHSLHYPLWISLFMIFAPASRPAEGARTVSDHLLGLLPIFAAQVMIGLFYTLSGVWKVLGGISYPDFAVSSFSPIALPLHAMARWDRTGVEPLLADFFISNVWVAWPAFLAVIYFELFFLIAVFRPQMHRLFGGALVCFHIGVWLVMGISFAYQSVMVAMLFLMSPFAVFDRGTLRQTILQFPMLGTAAALFFRFRSNPDQGRSARPGSPAPGE